MSICLGRERRASRFRWRVAPMAVGVGCVLGAGAFAQPEGSTGGPDVWTQLTTMARVLEETLDRSALGEWHRITPGRSAFSGRIETDYIPTIGAIFRLAVAFPLAEAPPGREPLAPPSDLWEQMSEQRSPPPSSPAPPRPLPRPSEPGRSASPAARPGGPEIEIERVIPSQPPAPEERPVLRQPPPRPPAARVRVATNRPERLREALVSAFATYGHRLTVVPVGERIIVVVEAQSPRPLQAPVWDGQRRGRATGTEERQSQPGADGTASGLILWPSDGPGGVFDLGGGGPLAIDRYALLIRRRDLTGAFPPEGLTGKIEEHRY